MRYLTFTIENYRAIVEPLSVEIDKTSLIPIIGVNESGKTTILHAIFAFDSVNDKSSDGVHLKDISNLYVRNAPHPTVTARISFGLEEWGYVCGALAKEGDSEEKDFYLQLGNALPNKVSTLEIVRDIETKLYSIPSLPQLTLEAQNEVAHQLVLQLPYILFFDDFRDRIPSSIKITSTKGESEWLGFMRQLFLRVDPEADINNLYALDSRDRDSLLSDVQDYLNERLTNQWKQMRLDKSDVLTVSVNYDAPDAQGPEDHGSLRLGIIEATPIGKRAFFLENRSKGFYWFFNFVIKLEFNDKAHEEKGQSAIYLLDEPGSYLHSSAQARLCLKLKDLSKKSMVIYGTHSHYLLNPRTISFKSIRVAEKNMHKHIRLTSIHEHSGSLTRQGAFQPVYDALQMQDFDLDVNADNILIVEGIYDYYAYQLMSQADWPDLGILPAANADSVRYHISEMLLKKKEFRALWDNDDAGRTAFRKAKEEFGVTLAKSNFRTLPLLGKSKNKTRLEDLFVAQDLVALKQALGLATGTSFEKIVTSWYYASNRILLTESLSVDTHQRFKKVFESLNLPSRSEHQVVHNRRDVN